MSNTQDNKLNEAKRWAKDHDAEFSLSDYESAFNDAITCDAAKQYWYEQFQLDNKQESAGVWVKVSRNIKDWIPHSHKVLNGIIVRLKDGSVITQKWMPSENCEYWWKNNVVEWLDESQPTTKPISDEMIQESWQQKQFTNSEVLSMLCDFTYSYNQSIKKDISNDAGEYLSDKIKAAQQSKRQYLKYLGFESAALQQNKQ